MLSEVILSFFFIGLGGREHLVVNHQNTVPHSHRRPLDPTPLAHPSILRPQIGFRLSRRMSRLHQHRFGMPISFAGPPTHALASTFMLSWANPHPRSQMS